MADNPRCHLRLTVLFPYVTSTIYNCALLKICIVFLFFCPSLFKTIVIVNSRKHRREPRATCIFVLDNKYFYAYAATKHAQLNRILYWIKIHRKPAKCSRMEYNLFYNYCHTTKLFHRYGLPWSNFGSLL